MRVLIIAALTVDGFIGRSSGHFADWTGGADKKVFVELTKKAGLVVMGSRTFATIGRALPERRNIVLTSRPDEIKVEGVEATSETPADLLKRLEGEGVNDVAVIGGSAVYHSFMRAGLVEELYVTYVPVLFGSGVTLFSDELDCRLTLNEKTELPDGAVLMHYIVKK